MNLKILKIKTQTNYAVLIVLSLFLCLYGCGKNEDTVIEEQPENISFLSIQAELKQEIKVSAGRGLTLEEILDNTIVYIYIDSSGPEGDLPIVQSAYRDLPGLIELPGGGSYRILMDYDIPLEFISESKFDIGSYGFDSRFSVSPGATTTINAELLLMDVGVTIDFTDEVLTNYSDIEVEANISGGYNVPCLVWMATDDTRTGYFDLSAIVEIPSRYIFSYSGDLNITIRAQADDGTEQIVTKTYPNANPNEHYIVTVSYATSTATINVTLGDKVIIEDEIPFPG